MFFQTCTFFSVIFLIFIDASLLFHGPRPDGGLIFQVMIKGAAEDANQTLFSSSMLEVQILNAIRN